jgi:tetratricopeptide (TPR) repeat protein
MTTRLDFIWDGILALAALMALVWLFIRTFKNSENRRALVLMWVSTLILGLGGFYLAIKMGPYGPLLIAAVGAALSVMWTPAISEAIMNPFTSIFDGGNDRVGLKPLYSIAIAKRQKGQYLEAAIAVREQLARFPQDVEGVLLLAGIQAEDMQDMVSAEMTVNRFCAHSRVAAGQFAAAMTHLADWHLQMAQDADSARLALEKIIDRYPDTELALVAAQRIAHLGEAEKMMLAKHDNQPIPLPQGVKNVGLLASSEFLQSTTEDPAALAGVYVKHLEKHPLDTEVREKLALIYADHYQRLDLAVAELEQMINVPHQPPKRVVHWLTLLANLQIRHGADYETVRQSLERIVTLFPNLPVAQSAQSRINHLRLEIKGRQEETPGKKLGVYEQNIGLRQRPPKRD